MSPGICLLLLLHVFVWVGSKAIANYGDCLVAIIGGVIDHNSRLGKEQKIAMEMAGQDHIFNHSPTCTTLDLHLKDSRGNPARATACAINLIRKKHVQAVIGTLTVQEAALVSESTNTTNNFPLISLTSPAVLSPTPTPFHSPTLFQMANDVVFQTQCIAAIVGHFNWRKVTAIYEHNNGLSAGSGIVTLLSDSLRSVNSEIEHHRAFPSFSSLSDPKTAMEEELEKLKRKSNRVFIVLQFSLESAVLLFEKATKMGMMGKGYVWIVADEIASLLDSVDSSVKYNTMQGVIGLKTSFVDATESFRRFKSRFRRVYGSHYPEEEENSSPSIFALRAYDAVTTIAKVAEEFQGQDITPKRLSEKLISIEFRGLSGVIKFKDGMLAPSPTFKIINVNGKSYTEIAFWSADHGFSKNLVDKDGTKAKETYLTGPIYWPGGLQTVPKGWNLSNEAKTMKIAIPANGAFHQFVSLSFNQERNETSISGFSINVFEAVMKRLPYHLDYVLVPFYGSYDQMVEQVYYKGFDAAVGDIEVYADRFKYVEFSQPYVSSGLQMVVTVEPDKVKERWMFMKAFIREMWLKLVFMHLFVCSVVWLIENHHSQNPELKGSGVMLWFSFTILFFAHREPLKCNLTRLVLAPWLFVILVVTASFTASLTSMLTVSQIKPSVLDIDTLRRTNAIVGCNGKSFIVRYLVKTLNLKRENVKNISSVDDYPAAFANGDIKAAFFLVPHAEVFLRKYCNGFIKAGPNYKLAGFGFAFPKGSPLTVDISVAILEVTESGKVEELERGMLHSFNCSSSLKLGGDPIGPEPFSSLFTISGVIATFAFLITFVGLAGKRINNLKCVLISKGFWRWAYIYLSKSSQTYKFHRSRTSPNQNGMFGDLGRSSNMSIELVP